MMEEKEERLAHGRVPQRDEVHAGNIAELLGEWKWLVGHLGDEDLFNRKKGWGNVVRGTGHGDQCPV